MQRLAWLTLLVAVGAAAWFLLGPGQEDALTPGGLPGEDGVAVEGEAQPGLIGSGGAATPEGESLRWNAGTDAIRVRVVDHQGDPLEGVQVELRARVRVPDSTNQSLAERARARFGNSHMRPQESYGTSTSGASGRLVFEGLHNVGQFRVLAKPSAPLCPSERVVPGSWGGRRAVPEIELTLLSGGPLAVRVVDGTGAGLQGKVSWTAAVADRPDAASISSPHMATGADGRLRFPSVPVGSVTLRAHVPGVGQVAGVRAAVPTDGEVRLVLGTTDPAEIFGRVLHPDGSPVPDATIWLKTQSSRPPHFLSEHEVAGDAEGRYEIKNVGGDTIWSLSATAPGHVLRHKIHERRQLPRGGRLELDILLPRGCVLDGQVVDVEDQPLVGATVRAIPNMTGGWGQWDMAKGTTDAQGRFRLEGVPPSKGQLSILMPGFQRTGPKGPPMYSVLEAGSQQTLRVVLSRGGTATGTLADEAGDPVRGVNVWLGTRRGTGWSDFSGQHVSKPTDENGRFLIQGFNPGGEWLLRAQSTQGYSDEVPLPPADAAGARDVPLTLRSGLVLEGSIFMGGRPANSSHEIHLSMGRGRFTRNVESDTQGAFAFLGLPPGEVELNLQKLQRHLPRQPRGKSPTRATVTLEAGKTPEPIRFELPAMGAISGKVVDADGAPIPFQQVVLKTEPQSAVPTQYARTDDLGRFRFSAVLDHEHAWTLHAGATEHSVVRVGQHDLVVTAVRPNHNAKLPGSLVRGRVLLADGGLLPRGRFQIMHGESGGQLGAGDVHDGQFQFRSYSDLPALVRVKIKEPRGLFGNAANVLPAEVEVPTGADVLEVRLQAGLRIAGRVLDEVGQPHEQPWCRVSIAPIAAPGEKQQQLPRQASMRVDKEGRFAFEGLEARRWRLRINTQGSPFLPPEPVDVESGDEALEYRLERGATISGRVVGPDGESLEHASIVFQAVDANGRHSSKMSYGTSKKDGSFEVGGIQAGTRGNLTVQPPHARRTAFVMVTIKDVASGSSGHVVELPEGLFIEGRIDASGFEKSLPPRFSVDAVTGEGADRRPYRATNTGLTFKLGPLLRGRYVVKVALGQGFPPQTPVTLDAPARDVVIRVSKGITVAVKVDHERARSFRLEWQAPDRASGGPVQYGRARGEGSFEFNRVDDELGTIYARNYKTGEMAVLHDVRPSRGPYTLRPSMGETIAGGIKSPHTGRFLIKAVGPIVAFASSAADGSGTFELKGLPPGSYDLSVENVQGSAREDGVRSGRTDVILKLTGR